MPSKPLERINGVEMKGKLKNSWRSARGNSSATLFRGETRKAMVQFGLRMKRIEGAGEGREDDRMVFK
jgi:hypothetical protein